LTGPSVAQTIALAPFSKEVLALSRKSRKIGVAFRPAGRHLSERLPGLGAFRPLRGLKYLVRGFVIGHQTCRCEAVHRLNKTQELPVGLFRFTYFVSC